MNDLLPLRRMELEAKAVLCGGSCVVEGSAVVCACDEVPNAHFNRISVVDPDRFDGEELEECAGRIREGNPLFIDVPNPAPERLEKLLSQKGYSPTGESRSSMLLAGSGVGRFRTDPLEILDVGKDTLDAFLDVFLRGFETPDELVPLAKAVLYDLVLRNGPSEGVHLYLGMFRGEPAATVYLYCHGAEGGVNMVATRKELRGRGIATAMVQHAVEQRRALGLHMICLETKWDSAPERLYRRLGFSTVARHDVFTNVPELKFGL